MHTLNHRFLHKKYNQLRFLAFALLLASFNSIATTVLPITFEELSSKANTIIHARVVANRVEQDSISGQIVTYTDFDVIDNIKGTTNKLHTIKQIGGQITDKEHTNQVQQNLLVPGVPSFITGKEYIVFLPTTSRLGFCSPLGLYQGSFIIDLINGEKVVSNGQNLISNTPTADTNMAKIDLPSAASSAPLSTPTNNPRQARLSDFINSIRAINAN